jgi:serine/threonine-protein kinase RsbW
MKYKYKVGCSIDNLKGIREFVRESLKGYPISEVMVGEIVLALDEMCSNLMIHAHHCNPDDLFELIVDTDKKSVLVFKIVDDGNTFDINHFHEPDLDRIIHQKRKGGLGIRLVKTIMDTVDYTSQSGKNVCILTKKIPAE